ncbi:MAG: ABC transporter permease [Anaerolineae bacterium]
MNVLTITNLTFREAWRKKLFWMALGLGLAFIVLFAVGFHFVLNDIEHNSRAARQGAAALNLLVNEVSGGLLIMGLFAVNVLIVMMTALTSAGAISGEIDSHTIQTIATKPVHRWEIVAGKWLGFAVMLVMYIIFMAGGLMTAVYLRSGFLPPNIVPALALLSLEGLIVLSVTIFGGTLFSTLATGVLVFMLYGIAFVGSWVEQIGALLKSETAVQVGIVASLIMPSETMWRMASDLLQSPLIRRADIPLITLYSKPSPAMAVYAVVYMGLFLAGALYRFSARDL